MKGKVSLVGAGPGNGSLLTLAAIRELQNAQVVLYDRLVGEDVLARIPPGAQMVDVGKSCGRHTIPQEEINQLILRYALEGKRVVRLKGGDPYLFGRGAEELEAVVEAGIPFAVIPGVTSALSVPSWAGIPITHREWASSVHIFTGHLKGDAPTQLDYESMVRLGGTLVFLMSVAAMNRISSGLIHAGMSPDTPAAVICNGTQAGQRKILSTISNIASLSAKEGIKPPAVFIVGQVCSLSHDLDWCARLPLSGKNILVTRPQWGPCGLSDRLESLGCGVIRFPCIRLEARETPEVIKAVRDSTDFPWLAFTSAYGVEVFFGTHRRLGLDIRDLRGIRFAAIGRRTAQGVEERGIPVDCVPEIYDARHLALALSDRVAQGESVMLFRAAAGTEELPHILSRSGISFRDVAAYDTIYQNPAADTVASRLRAGEIDLVTFTSASTVEGFVRAVKGLDVTQCTAVCIGQQTQQQAQQYGFQTIVSKEATLDSMVDRILEYCGEYKPKE